MDSSSEFIEPWFWSRLSTRGVSIVQGPSKSGRSKILSMLGQRLQGIALGVQISVNSSTTDVYEAIWYGMLDRVRDIVERNPEQLYRGDPRSFTVVARLLKAKLQHDYNEFLLLVEREHPRIAANLSVVSDQATLYQRSDLMKRLIYASEALVPPGYSGAHETPGMPHLLIDIDDDMDWSRHGPVLSDLLCHNHALRGFGYAATACLTIESYARLQAYMPKPITPEIAVHTLEWRYTDFLNGVNAFLRARSASHVLEELVGESHLALMSDAGSLAPFTPLMPLSWQKFGELLLQHPAKVTLSEPAFIGLFRSFCRETQPLTIVDGSVYVGSRRVEMKPIHVAILQLLSNVASQDAEIGADQLSSWLKSHYNYQNSSANSVSKAIVDMRKNTLFEPLYQFREVKSHRHKNLINYCTYLLNDRGYRIYRPRAQGSAATAHSGPKK